MTRVNIQLNDDLHKKVKAQAAIAGITLIEYINNTLKERIKKDF